MRKFNVTVDGKMYEVEVEEVAVGSAAPKKVAPVTAAPKASAPVAPAPVAKKEPVSAPAPAAPAGGTKLLAPMPGAILDLKFSNGQTVKKGEVVLILEAMKMENEVVSTADGVITYSVSKGSNVNCVDVLAVLA